MKKQALLIGINEYQILPGLKYARQDAEAVADALKQNYCFSDNEVMVLTDAKPGLFKPTNRYIIQNHLDKLANQELDLFIFGFWGHGLFRNGKRYLCPLDVQKIYAEQQGLPFDELQELLAKIHAKNTCLILDCCQTIHDRGEVETLTASDKESMENAARDIVFRRKQQIPDFQSNVAILNSCKEGQSAYEWDARQHGLFTAHLLDAMKKRSNSVMQIASYISSNIEKTALELGKEQTPFYKLEGDIPLPVSPISKTPEFVLPPLSKDAVIQKTEIEDINVTFTPGQVERQQRIQYDKIQLPEMPEELINIQAENKGRQTAIAQLKDLTHESLSQANAAVDQAQAQFEAWSERKERLWKELSEDVQQSLEETISNNPECTEADINVPMEGMSNQEYFDLLERFECGRKFELARLELERVQNQRQEKCANVITELQQKIASENARVEEIRSQFMDEVLLCILAVMPGYEEYKAAFPADVIREPLRLLDKYELGWRAPAEMARARALWKKQRPCVLEHEPDLSLEGREAGERAVMTINGVEFAFRWCPAGTFMMGSPTSENGRNDDEKQHQVTLTKGFWMMETEVTQKQWKAVMGNNPSNFKGDDLPVEQVSWNDCQEFCKKCVQLGLLVQLPTEAQWEYACRAGSTTAYFWGNALNGDKANCDGNYPCGTTTIGKYLKKTTPVGSYAANAWGLYDMHGNVWEWCQDWFGDYPSGSVTDPTGPSNGSDRVIRGGSWNSDARSCRSAYRFYNEPGYRSNRLGFRVAKGQ